MRVVLTVTGGPQLDRQWTIEADRSFTIGRGDAADAVLLDAEISRIHCRIQCAGGSCFIEDQNSLNGTYVNGERVQRAELRHGDTVRIGGSTLRVDLLGAAEPAGPTALAGEPGEPTPGRPEAAPRLAPPKIVRITEEKTVQEFIDRHPSDTSNIVLSLRQKLWYVFVAAAFAAVLVYDYLYFLLFVHLLCTFYLVVIAYKLVTILLSVVWRWEIRVGYDELGALEDADLPVYTILVPLYKESAVADKILRHIANLDYPRDKLDVKLLLEPDDPETLEAIRDRGVPDFCEVIVCPDSLPKTKPKACNHGLARARGEYTVIYDAEDRPEPDQLKKAVIGFRRAQKRWKQRRWIRVLLPFRRVDGGATACLQAKLNYYNPKQNLLTRWFVIEYATWFQLFLPGLHALRAPIPLGGTSNHFRTDVLHEIGGWDPFNVTEDCDLGIRLHKLGYRTEVLDTTTWEEANSRVGNWIRQRSRWVKGYLQTHFTHMRHPLRTLWQLGPTGMFHFLNSVGGLSLMLLLNPLFWMTSLLYVGLFAMDLHEHGYSLEGALGVKQAIEDAGDEGVRDRTVRIPHPDRRAWTMVCATRPYAFVPSAKTWQARLWACVREDWKRARNGELWTQGGLHFWNIVSQVFVLCTAGLVLGNVFFVLVHVIACLRSRMPGLIPFALLMPFYWVLISVAAWKGLFQLLWKPFYWEKTRHGLDRGSAGGL